MTSWEKPRKYPRHKPPAKMYVGWQAAGYRAVSPAEALGLGGIFLRTPNPPPRGTMIKLLFDLKTGEVRARAIVRDSRAGEGMGVQFVEMEPSDRARVFQLLQNFASAELESGTSSKLPKTPRTS